jgi:hypothetical protein
MMLRVCLCLGMLGVFAGCSGETSKPLPATVEVSGKVTLDGAPLTSAMVTYVPKGETKGIECVGVTDDTGEYTLKQIRGKDGAPPGEYTVVINRYVKADGSPIILDGSEPPANLGAVESLPPHYSSASDSTLTKTVPEAGGKLDFELVSK